MTYSSDFRCKVLSVREKEGLTNAQGAARFCVGVASITRWIKNPDPKRRRNKPARKIDREALARDVDMYPDAYRYERAQRLGVSPQGIGHALKRLGVSYKKNAISHPKSNDEKRLICQNKRKAYEAAGLPIVYSNESGFAHDMPRTARVRADWAKMPGHAQLVCKGQNQCNRRTCRQAFADSGFV